jgi:hypothetical protein
MARRIEFQLTSCLTDMENMQRKVSELLDAKKKVEIEIENKLKKIEPNISILNNWLRKHEQIIEEELTAKEIEIKYRNRPNNGSDPCESKERAILNNVRNGYHIERNKHFSYDPNFMKDFIEANYNIFNLQQKRIDELEDRIWKLEN